MSTAATIYALASAAGKSGVAVFRISGPKAREALVALGVEKELTPRVATLVTLTSPLTTHHSPFTIDRALALFFPSPNSFTGEDVVELHTHGSRAVTKMLLEALKSISGLRMAEPGEFARRAFLNHKLDLAQVEGLGDLIDADTPTQHAQAMRQLGGDTTLRVEALRGAILEPLALMEAYIDFPDEEIPEAVLTQTTQRVEALIKEINELLDDGGIGEKIREGLEIVILGAPNAGKSSLLNALARRDAAIVSAEAGTTRDLIEIQMEIAGYAVTLVDTAGIRETTGEIESEGIRRALARAENADLKLRLFDITTIAEFMRQEEASTRLLPSGEKDGMRGPSTSEKRMITPSPNPWTRKNDTDVSFFLAPSPQGERASVNDIIVATKSDLAPLPPLPFPVIAISTKTGQGLDHLTAALIEAISQRMESANAPLITRARHREAMEQAARHLARFHPGGALEINCEELRLAANAIGKITGKIWVDDLLDLIFSRFCIGK